MNRRFFLTTTLAGLLALPASARATTPEEAQRLVRHISDELIALIRSGADNGAKRAEFAHIIETHSDIRQIAGFALGRYARSMPEALKSRYVDAFKRFVAATYVGYFDDYDGETIEVGTARPTNNGYTVETSVIRRGQPPLAVRWDLSGRSGQLLVEDFVIEGISMAASQRGEFASLINSYGGDVEQFVRYLEARG